MIMDFVRITNVQQAVLIVMTLIIVTTAQLSIFVKKLTYMEDLIVFKNVYPGLRKNGIFYKMEILPGIVLMII